MAGVSGVRSAVPGGAVPAQGAVEGGPGLGPAASRRSVPPAAPAGEPSPFARLLRGLTAAVEEGESLGREAVGAARRGATLAPADLLALQVSVCRYSEALDLAARLVDRSTSSVKTVLQGG